MGSASILLVEDDNDLREAIATTIGLSGYNVITLSDPTKAINIIEQESVGLVISDIQMPGMNGDVLQKKIALSFPQLPVILMTAYSDINGAVSALQSGAVDYIVKPFAPDELMDRVKKYYVDVVTSAKTPVMGDDKTKSLYKLARKVAQTDTSILITGKSGTGKEVLANYIHQNSPRSQGAFVAQNCAAIPDNLLEATLFGYEKGAFTGASQATPGKFEQAQGGTILLDEITEMDLSLQAKLLRVLQEREVERIGGRKLIKLDVRVIATSNRDLRVEVAKGRFREDLYYRLNVFPLSICALNERKQDILLLAEGFVRDFARLNKTGTLTLNEGAKAKLLNHDWPGNVRELHNVVQRALILHEDDYISAEDILFEQSEYIDSTVGNIESQSDLVGTLKNKEFELIALTLKAHGGSRKETAEALGLSPRTLRYKLAKMREAGIAFK